MSRLISVQLEQKNPITEPVTLQEVKDYLKIDFSDEDTLIESLITSARQKCERLLGLCLVDTEVNALYQSGGTMIELGYSNIKSDGSGGYVINGLDSNDTLRGAGVQKWVKTDKKELEISYTSGFDKMPQWAKTGVLKQIAWDYENRGDELEYDKIAPETMAVLNPYRTTLHEMIL